MNYELKYFISFVIVFLINGCGQKQAETEKDVSEELPYFTKNCKVCHDYNLLEKTVSDEDRGIKEWMSGHAGGLVRFDPAIPSPAVQIEFPWIKRGRHAQSDMKDCSACHPVLSDGLGHGIRSYPSPVMDMVFSGGKSCAGNCHEWIKESVGTAGFKNAEGQNPSYKGSLRPAALLQDAENAHSVLWKEGMRPESGYIKISAFNPGCGGCHNVSAESHGTISSCLDCHSFGGSSGELHKMHVSWITDNADENNADQPQMSFCAYCHRDDSVPPDKSSAACYNCHLSGHQPVGKNGTAHFWKIE
jgi:hypothetical protein